jgi:hypothetical protein
MKTYSDRTIAQANRVAELLAAGYTVRAIARELNLTSPRISQIKRALPELQAFIRTKPVETRLEWRRDELVSLRREALALARKIGQDLRELQEELEAVETDRILGLRPQ